MVSVQFPLVAGEERGLVDMGSKVRGTNGRAEEGREKTKKLGWRVALNVNRSREREKAGNGSWHSCDDGEAGLGLGGWRWQYVAW